MVTMTKNKKVIILDWGVFMHTAIGASMKITHVHPCNTCPCYDDW